MRDLIRDMASNEPQATATAFEADPRLRVTPRGPHTARSSNGHRPTHLQPLATAQITQYQRRHSGPYLRSPASASPMSPETPDSAASLATPSLLGVRQYYRENGLYTAFQSPSPPLAPAPTPLNPRRHSIVSPSGLASRFDKLQASSPLLPGMSPTIHRRSIVDESRDMLLDGVNRSELSRLGSVVTEAKPGPDRRPSEQSFVPLGKPPFDRLREWGNAYLGNASTADVFVRALHIRQNGNVKEKERERCDSVISNKSDDGLAVPQSDDDHVVIRARVLPRSKQRKPFLIQRRFNKADLRAASPAKTEDVKGEENSDKSGLENDDKSKEKDKDEMLGVEVQHPRSKSTPSPQPTPLHSPRLSEV
jgi:hypothetical protein